MIFSLIEFSWTNATFSCWKTYLAIHDTFPSLLLKYLTTNYFHCSVSSTTRHCGKSFDVLPRYSISANQSLFKLFHDYSRYLTGYLHFPVKVYDSENYSESTNESSLTYRNKLLEYFSETCGSNSIAFNIPK